MALIDNFNDTEGPPMTGWVTPALAAGLKSNGTTCLANAANAFGIWNTIMGHADEEAEVTITTKPATAGQVGVMARAKDISSAAIIDGYAVSVLVVAGAGNDIIRAYRIDNGVSTPLGTGIAQEVSNNDSIKIRIVGSSIGVWYKASGGSWTLLETVTDATYSAAGYLGLFSTDTTARMDDFGGGVYVPEGNPHHAYAQQ